MIVDLAGRLCVENVSDQVDRLAEAFIVNIDDQDLPCPKSTLTVPAGFVTDYCSVPNIPFVHELLGDIGKRAGVVHDYLYSSIVDPRLRARGRSWADQVLYAGLRAQGIAAWKARLMWTAVRLAGCRYFQPIGAAGDEPEAGAAAASGPAPADPGGQPNY